MRPELLTRSLWLGAGALVAIGTVLKIVMWAAGTEFWNDEAGLGINVVGRTYATLGSPFTHLQASGWGFLAVSKAVTDLAGPTAIAFRFVPMVAALFVPAVVYAVAREVRSQVTGLLALGIAAVSPYLLTYTRQFKPYTLDALIAGGLVWMATRAARDPEDSRWWVALAVAGTISVWVSLPAIFVLTAVGLALFVRDLVERRSALKIAFTVLMGVAWLLSFAVHYGMFLAHSGLSKSPQMQVFWARGFINFPPRSIDDVRATFGRFFYSFVEPGGFYTWRYLAAFWFAVGIWWLVRRSKVNAAIVTGPYLIAFAAATLGLYPFDGRLLLFLYPTMIVLIAVGLAEGWSRSWWLPRAVAALSVVVFMATSGAALIEDVRYSIGRHPTPGDVMAELFESIQPEDRVYVQSAVVYQYDFYVRALRGNDPPWVVRGKKFPLSQRFLLGDESHGLIEQLRAFRGRPRVWVILPTFRWPDVPGPTLERWVVDYLDRHGRRLSKIEGAEVRAYLYDLR